MRALFLFTAFVVGALYARAQRHIDWVHLSSAQGQIEVPNHGNQQTSAIVSDFNNDGINDFVITERTRAPAVVLYIRKADGWQKTVIEDKILSVEAGGAACDVDGDGDMDLILGGDFQSNQVWWFENPYPHLESAKRWNRYLIRNSGGNKSHDRMVGDFDGDGKSDLVFWVQGDNTLYFTRIPEKPKETSAWKLIPVYTYYTDGQMEQRGEYPRWKGINEHEGLAKADIDGDGMQDIVGGGMWFKYLGNDRFAANIIDASYTFSRSAAGQLIEGGRPEVVMVVGDGSAPLSLYQFVNGTWTRKDVVPKVRNGHTLDIVDFNGDGHLDIWNAEMALDGNKEAINHILLGDGAGNFPEEIVVSRGVDLHESKIADLDGDGDLDILGKPYSDAPGIDVWLQNGTGKKSIK